MSNKSLMVIVSDVVTDILKKGEYTPRYYNPGDYYRDVHLLMTNDDRPRPEDLQYTVGSAHLHLYNIPSGKALFVKSAAWRPRLLQSWAKKAVAIAREVRPAIIRCYGNYLNAYLASEIKRELGIPYVVSMHINPDEDIHGKARTIKQRLNSFALRSIEKGSLLQADLVMPVYRPIIPYVERIGAKKMEVVYNIMDVRHLKSKANYEVHDPIRIVSVGRLFEDKCPDNLIRAVRGLNAQLTIVGDGPKADYLRHVAEEVGAAGMVSFVKAMPNDRLCAFLAECDIYATHSEYHEVSKAILEAMLTGLPVVINRRRGAPVPELIGDHVMMVDNLPEAYRNAMCSLIEDNALRENIGRRGLAYARAHWEPNAMERRVVDIYRSISSLPSGN